MRPITLSFGAGDLATITAARTLPWEKFAAWLTAEPLEVTDKASRGWYIPATFDPQYRDGDNFVSRDCITFDFDHVTIDSWGEVIAAWENIAFAMYTTYSHMSMCKSKPTDCALTGTEHPRFRVVIPLSRPAGYDEFQALARKVAMDVGIERVARESFVPAQMMFSPTRKLGGAFVSHINPGPWLDVDAVLAEYGDWTDVKQWPHRKDGDGVHKISDGVQRPDEKNGPVGDFCRLFRIPEAIARFELPYTPTATVGRWTYTAGSRPEGAIEYDDGLKLHSHHDTDPARGQHNAFDLVRLHKFGSLDAGTEAGTPVTSLPSYRSMCELVAGLPGVAAAHAANEFIDLGEPEVTSELRVELGTGVVNENATARFLVRSALDFSSGPPMDWIVRGVLPRAELAVIFGESGSGKSFLALDLCAAVARGIEWREKRTTKGSVVYVAAEGAGGFKARLRAYARAHDVGLAVLPSVVSDAPNLLEAKDAADLVRAILTWGKPDVVVIDTLSATAPGGNENSGEDMGRVLSHCKFIYRKTGALVVLIHHSGKDATKGARGWSGLRAAADAEIEVTRNGDYRSLTVTKMKDFVDGERLDFKLKVVSLGPDAYGDEQNSCVLEHVAAGLAPTGTKLRATGKNQIPMYDMLKVMAPSGTVNYDDLVEGYVKKMPKGEGRDLRRRDAKRAIEELISKRLAHMHGEDRVSLTSLIQEDTTWLK